jgi:hypothetical protein
MAKERHYHSVLGVDIGQITTRSALFGISEGKYRLTGEGAAPTSLGYGQAVNVGIKDAILDLQAKSDGVFFKPGDQTIKPLSGVDQVVWTMSGGMRVRTVLLGVAEGGSIAAGRVLADSLPLEIVTSFGLPGLADETGMVDRLINLQPSLVLIVGGEDGGAQAPIRTWVDIMRSVCLLLPEEVKPTVVYAGNPALHPYFRRRLEPVTKLSILPNLQPQTGLLDLVPVQRSLDREILKNWKKHIPGWVELDDPLEKVVSTTDYAWNRMVRYLSRTKEQSTRSSLETGVVALDIGGGVTRIAIGMQGNVGMVSRNVQLDQGLLQDEDFLQSVRQWTAASVSIDDVQQYLINYWSNPAILPETQEELAISQAYARVRIKQAVEKVSAHYGWIPFDSVRGLLGLFEPIIASGAVLTQAPSASQTMLMILDGLQPRGVSTVVLDRHQILPMLGVIGGIEPLLPVQLLASDVFENLGTVIVPESDLAQDEIVLRVHVEPETGKEYSVDISQGELRHLVVPAGMSVVLTLEPHPGTDIGFGGPGVEGRLKVTSGRLGVVIDARGRPLVLEAEDEFRLAQLQRWSLAIGG